MVPISCLVLGCLIWLLGGGVIASTTPAGSSQSSVSLGPDLLDYELHPDSDSLQTTLRGKFEITLPVKVSHGFQLFSEDPAAAGEEEELEFQIRALGRELHLQVSKQEHLFSPDYKEVTMSGDGEIIAVSEEPPLNCFYQGKILGEPESSAAVSLCDGISGVIQTEGETLHIAPAHRHFAKMRLKPDVDAQFRRPSSDSRAGLDLSPNLQAAHIVYRKADMEGIDDHTCGVNDNGHDHAHSILQRGLEDGNVSSSAAAPNHRLLASCPGGPTKYLEVMVVNDLSRSRWLGASTQTRTANIVNIADSYYAPTNFRDFCIRLRLVGQITYTERDAGGVVYRPCNTVDPDRPSLGPGCYSCGTACNRLSTARDEIDHHKLLNTFTTTFMGQRRSQLEALFGSQIDNMHLFTSQKFASSTVGLAWVGTICNVYSTGITQATSLDDAYTAQIYAHEVGHNWGMRHDPRSGYIMAASSNANNYPTQFSSASIDYLAGESITPPSPCCPVYCELT